jgi:hypothetical protein
MCSKEIANHTKFVLLLEQFLLYFCCLKIEIRIYRMINNNSVITYEVFIMFAYESYKLKYLPDNE